MKYKPRGQFIAALLTLIIMGGALYSGALAIVTAVPSKPIAAAVAAPKFVSVNPDILAAKSALLYDPATRTVLYQKNGTQPLPLASLTKLMTLQTVLDVHDPSRSVRIGAGDIVADGDWGLRPGDTVPLRALVKLGLIISSNDAMAAAAASLGTTSLERINLKAHELGLTDMVFYDPTGLDISSSTAGAYGSAYDVARLASAFYAKYPDIFELTRLPSIAVTVGNRTLGGAATDAPLLSVPGILGAKTGYTALAGGNLVTIFDVDIGHPLVGVVLGSTQRGRFDDMRVLIEAARAQL